MAQWEHQRNVVLCLFDGTNCKTLTLPSALLWFSADRVWCVWRRLRAQSVHGAWRRQLNQQRSCWALQRY